jgi:uncharacterized protein
MPLHQPFSLLIKPASADCNLGNIRTDTWEDIGVSSRYRDFGERKSELTPACSDCENLAFCSGDCLKHRLYGQGEIDQLSWLCTGWKHFYQHASPGFIRLANQISTERTLPR